MSIFSSNFLFVHFICLMLSTNQYFSTIMQHFSMTTTGCRSYWCFVSVSTTLHFQLRIANNSYPVKRRAWVFLCPYVILTNVTWTLCLSLTRKYKNCRFGKWMMVDGWMKNADLGKEMDYSDGISRRVSRLIFASLSLEGF